MIGDMQSDSPAALYSHELYREKTLREIVLPFEEILLHYNTKADVVVRSYLETMAAFDRAFARYDPYWILATKA